MYEDPDTAWDAQIWNDLQPNAERRLEVVQRIGNIANPVEFATQLEALPPTSDERLTAAALLANIHAPKLLQAFGETVTAWTIGNDADSVRSHLLTLQLEDEGYNPTFLGWARAISREAKDRRAPTGADVLAQNRVMENVAGPALQQVDLGASLQASRAPSVEPLSNKRINSYALIPLQIDPGTPFLYSRVRSWEGQECYEKDGRTYPMYMDTPTGFALTYKGIPQMMVGVKAASPDELHIQQLQGVMGELWRGKSMSNIGARGLPPIDWRKLGVHISAQLAERSGMHSVSMPHSSTVRRPGWSYIDKAKAKKAYDDPATRLRFKRRGTVSWHRSTANIIRDQSTSMARA